MSVPKALISSLLCLVALSFIDNAIAESAVVGFQPTINSTLGSPNVGTAAGGAKPINPVGATRQSRPGGPPSYPNFSTKPPEGAAQKSPTFDAPNYGSSMVTPGNSQLKPTAQERVSISGYDINAYQGAIDANDGGAAKPPAPVKSTVIGDPKKSVKGSEFVPI